MSSTNEEPVTLERILDRENLGRAYRQVVANKGAPGVDGMKVSELADYCRAHPNEISQAVLNGKYRPKPIRRKYIPKDNGDRRPLGIPTVTDRLVQQATAQVLSDFYEPYFSDNSFGFRPGRGCRQAIERATEYANSGRPWVIDLDLAKFFDTVNHSKLLQVLSERIKDGRVISLIHRFLRAPVSEDGKVGSKTTMGTPQGGCISPVLANILLNELDQLLDSRGIKFVRYADDLVAFCGSRKAAERVLGNIKKFVEKKLFLKVNETKTKIVHVSDDVQFLGFTFTQRVNEERKRRSLRWKWFPSVHPKKRTKLHTVLKTLLDRRAPGGIEKAKRQLRLKLRGWCAYFGESIPRTWMRDTDQWIRRRIRQIYWKQWKTPEARHRAMKRLWKEAPEREDYAYSANSYWRMSNTRIIHQALCNRVLEKEGWVWIRTFAT